MSMIINVLSSRGRTLRPQHTLPRHTFRISDPIFSALAPLRQLIRITNTMEIAGALGSRRW
jgi:hypothetical protein